MKYSPTTRLINLIVNCIIFAAFGCAAFYFCFWANPGFFNLTMWSDQAQIWQGDYPYNFTMQLGMLSMAIMVLGIFGIVYSLKSLRGKGSDTDVRNTFLVYCAMGNAVALFSILNAAIFFDLIANGTSVAFFIVLFVIVFIGALLGSNIPMTRILDDKDNHLMQIVFSAAFGSLLFGYLMSTGLTWILTMVALSNNTGDVWGYAARLGMYDGLCLLGLIACIFSIIFAERKQDAKWSAFLFGCAFAIVGICFIVDGTLEWVWRRNGSNNTFCYSLMTANGNWAGFPYMCMAIIGGSFMVLIGAGYSISSFLPEKEKSKKHHA